MKNKHKINLLELFDALETCNYVLSKLETPYTSSNFPEIYPIGKDLDMYSTKEDFDKINTILVDFSKKYWFKFRILKIKNEGRFRLRFKVFFKMHYMVDNNCIEKNLPSLFIEEAIKNRKKVGNYFVLDEKYEVVFRLSGLLDKPTKLYHVAYIKKYADKVNFEFIPTKVLKDLFLKIIN